MDKSQVQVGDIFPTNQGCSVVVLFTGNSGKFLVEFRDKTRHQCFVRFDDLINGNVNNPYAKIFYGMGYIGDGDFREKSHPNDEHGSIEFIAWLDFMSEVSAKPQLEPTDHRFLNFQRFADWFTKQYECSTGFLAREFKVGDNK